MFFDELCESYVIFVFFAQDQINFSKVRKSRDIMAIEAKSKYHHTMFSFFFILSVLKWHLFVM